MPHVLLEYSDNLNVDVKEVFARIHDELVATGVVNMKGIRSRAFKHTEYLIADGHESYKFVHVEVLWREGRSVDIQKEATQRIMKVLEDYFGQYFVNDYIALSVNLRELRADIALNKHNIPEGGVQS